MNLLKSQNRINELLARFVTQVKGSGSMGLTDLKKVSETILIPLLSEIFDYKNLENINYAEQNDNFPGIDLGDTVARVAIQVTSTSTIEKIKHTLTQFLKHRLNGDYDRCVVYILSEKQRSYSQKGIDRIVEDSGFNFDPKRDIWDFQTLLKEIANLPIDKVVKVEQILEKHFGEKEVLSLTPFVSPENFFHHWLDSDRLFNHSWNLEGRASSLNALSNFLESNQQVAILPGRGGIGKTKLLHGFSRTVKNAQVCLLFAEENIDITPKSLNHLPLEPCAVVIDDAHRRTEDVSILCKFINERSRLGHPSLKLILSSRPHAVDSLEAQLGRDGISYTKMDELKALTKDETLALARQALGQSHSNLAEQLTSIARDSPLVVVVGGQLLSEQSISAMRVGQEDEFRENVLNRFQDIAVGKVSEQVSPDICKRVLDLASVISSIPQDNEFFLSTAANFLKIDKVMLVQILGELEKAGVLLRRGRKLRITPDVLADHILSKACLTYQGTPTGYAEDVFEAFKEFSPSQVLRSLAELDWKIHYSYEKGNSLIQKILRELKEQFKAASLDERYSIIGLLKGIAFYQPAYAIEIVQIAMRPPRPSDKGNVRSPYDMTHQRLLSQLPAIITQVSYTFDYVPTCCNILWQLGRDDDSRPRHNFPDSIRALINLAKYGFNKPLGFNREVLKAIQEWLKEPNAHSHIYSPLDIIDPLLHKEMEDMRCDGLSLKISRSVLNYTQIQKLRDSALQILEQLLVASSVSVILRSLQSLMIVFRELTDRQTGQPLEEENKIWEPEQLKVLEMLSILVVRNDVEPLIQLTVMQELKRISQRSSSKSIRERSLAILASVVKTDQLQITSALIGYHPWNKKACEFSYDWKKREQAIELANKSIVQMFVSRYQEPEQGIQALNERLLVVSKNRERISDGFFSTLSTSHPEYAIELCVRALSMGESCLSQHLHTLLYPAKEFDSSRVSKVVESAINSEINSLCLSFASKYWAWEKYFEATTFKKLSQRLIQHPELEIRKPAVSSLRYLIQSNPQMAIALALEVDVKKNPEALEEIFHALSMIHLDKLTAEEFRALLRKLEVTERLDDYHISQFLIYAIKKSPYSVLNTIDKRIEGNMRRHIITYRPLPSNSYRNCLHFLKENENYEELLRYIRDKWFSYELELDALFEQDSVSETAVKIMSRQRMYQELFKEASYGYIDKSTLDVTTESVSLLREWLETGDALKIQSVSQLISRFNSGFIFRYLDLVKDLLEQSFNVSDECYESVSGNLIGSAISGVRMGKSNAPFPQDIALRNSADEVACQFHKGTPVRKFFDSIIKQANSEIASQENIIEEILDRA